jgi:hypothetical protein
LLRRIVPPGKDDPIGPEVIVKKGQSWVGVVILVVCLVVILVVCLVVTLVVDTDGDALTQDFPDIVLVSPTPSVEATRGEERVESGREAERERGRRRERVLTLHRTPCRWKAVLQRWHRSFLGDPPI